jgi:hypothetical protein
VRFTTQHLAPLDVVIGLDSHDAANRPFPVAS